MPSRIGSNSPQVRAPTPATSPTPITDLARTTNVGLVKNPVGGGFATPNVAADAMLADLAAKKPAIGTTAKQLFEALVDRRVEQWQASNYRGTREDAVFQELGTLRLVHDAANGTPSGSLITQLKNLATRDAYGPKVRAAASRLGDALADSLKPIAIPFELKNGPVKLPFTATVNGREVKATLVGTLEDGYLSSARAQVNGKAMVVTDGALTELLARAGQDWDPENSSQTEVLSRGLLGFGGVPKAITFDGTGFREVNKQDFEGAWVYYHKGEIALGPGQ